jgi:hypothetical protein
MTISEKEYFTQRNKQIERRKKLIAVVSMVTFFGSLLFTGVSTMYKSLNAPKVDRNLPLAADTSLQQQARGYESVLQREPNNQVALEKLSLVRLQLQDVKGSVDILEKLAKEHPDRKDYQVLLRQMRKQQSELKN